MPDTPLNPDALEAARLVYGGLTECEAASDCDDCDECQVEAGEIIRAYLAVAQPGTQKITDAEWQEFQAIPDQGYSHRSWVDARIAERVAVAQPEVNSVEELDQLPVGSLIMMRGVVAPFLRTDDGWESTRTPGKPVWDYTTNPSYLPARLLYLPEVNDGR